MLQKAKVSQSIRRRKIRVIFDQTIGTLSVRIIADNPTDPDHYAKSTLEGISDLETTITQFSTQLTSVFQEIVSFEQPSESKWLEFEAGLSSLGNNIFNTVIPRNLVEYIRQWEPGWIVEIYTNEQFIPWELLNDREGSVDSTWGAKFQVIRSPVISEIPVLSESVEQEQEIAQKVKGSRLVKKVLNVVGSNLGSCPNNESCADRVSRLFLDLVAPDSVIIQNEPDLSDISDAVAQSTLIHFTCHGIYNPVPGMRTTPTLRSSRNLYYENVRALGLDRATPFVFANSCGSAASRPSNGSRNLNLGGEFYACGTDVFVGTLAEVPIQNAVFFAEYFYRELLHTDRHSTVDRALSVAKRRAINHRTRRVNPYWLLYCVIGRSDYYLRVSPN
jgi:hypothetical protein